ncbi:MAG: hypothetical protein MUF49_04560 [Oculatellaceae cyanobacterium Prado106]|jgi:hypothetical protein|nr:hypothetical protein [Oculatellaceae cyanobacterium Prado106]
MASSSELLTLTNAERGQSSFTLYTTAVDATQGLSITFDFFSYGGTGGDGLSFILVDGSQSPVRAGGFGGSLGYAQRDDGGTLTPGIQGGYLGIGFDEFGNFSNSTEGRVGGAVGGLIPDAIVVRGRETSNPATSYAFLTGTGTLRPATAPTGLDNPGATNRNQAKRTAQIDLTSTGLLSVKIDFNGDGIFDANDPNEVPANLQNFNVEERNGVLPSTLKFGFAASTGLETNIHEVGNFNVRTQSGAPIAGSFSDRIIIGGDSGTPSAPSPIVGQTGNDVLIPGNGVENLQGGRGADRFVYSGATKAEALRKSTLRRLDRIADFRFSEGDRIQLDFDGQLATSNLPRRLFNAGAETGSLRKAARAAYADKNQSKRGNQALKPNEAVLFTRGSRTYLSVNDDQRSFSPRRDLLVDVTGIQLRPGDASLGALSVTNYFA